MYKGILHAHSTYSDGDLSLPELREALVRDGYRFACMTDHAEWLTEPALRQYVDECNALSDGEFRFIPGLEYECENRLHVLGYGTTVLIGSSNPEEVIARVHSAGGVSVIAHPKGELFDWIESFDTLPVGLEVWNSKYDGRYAPRAETFALLRRLQARQPGIVAFYGQDLHWRHQYRGLYVEIDRATPERGDVLGALASGAFRGCKQELRLPSSGELSASVLQEFSRVHRRSDRMRRILKTAKGVAGALGVTVPAGVKSQLRRVF